VAAGVETEAVAPSAFPRRGAVRLLVTGQAASTIGDACYAVALPWYVLSGHGGVSTLGAALTAFGVARAAAMPAGGALCDRLGARRVLLTVDVLRAILVAGLAGQAAAGQVSAAVLVLFSILIGACQGAFVPGSFALMPSITRADRLQQANAALTGALQAGSLAGPLLGAALIAAGGPATAFALDAATFALSAATLARLPRVDRAPHAQAAPARPLRTMITETPALPIMLVVVLAGNLASSGLFAVALPVLAHGKFGSSGYGIVLAVLAGGAVCGTALGSIIRARRPAVVASFMFLSQCAALALVPVGGLAGATTAAAAFGAANAIGELVMVTALQRSFPQAVLGRLMGLLMLASAGAFPLSVELTSTVVRYLGTGTAFPLGAAFAAAAILFGLSWRAFRQFGAVTSD
jgi:MFS family permease